MSNKPNFKLLKEAYAIIDGIPEQRINLDKIATCSDPHACHTIACAVGWLGMHPKFIARGLVTHEWIKHGFGFTDMYDFIDVYDWLRPVFRLTRAEAVRLFIYASEIEKHTLRSDKQIWLHRVRSFLSEHEQL